ncbi:MAG: RNA 3'-terminal phosphate cyclase [Candidatus Helarchaeota archaeon]
MEKQIIEIDGSKGEGGGAILRLTTAISVLLLQPVRVINIRKNRPKPGLKTQHLRGLEALARICNGKLINGYMGSEEISFQPGAIKGGTHEIKVETAGSIGLLLQLLTLACIRIKEPISFTFDGGATFGLWAPTLTYLENVTFRLLHQMGYSIQTEIKKHGFYPKGGAVVFSKILPPTRLEGLDLERQGKIESIDCISIATRSLEKRNVAERQARAAGNVLREKLKIKPNVILKSVEARNPGSGICLCLKTDTGVILGADRIGEKRVRAEDVGRKCALSLINDYKSGATCDHFCSDQLIPYIALAERPSTFLVSELTKHARTNIWLVEILLKRKIQVRKEGHLCRIHVNGS